MLEIYFSNNFRMILRLKQEVFWNAAEVNLCFLKSKTMFFMPNKIYSFTSDFDWRATFVTNAIQIAFPFLIK